MAVTASVHWGRILEGDCSLLRLEFVVASLVVAGSAPLLAERGILVLNVQDTQGTPIAGVEIGAKGDGGSAVTGKDGKARVPLAAGTKEKSHVDLQIIRPKTLVFIEPWENPVQVPSFENESANYVRVVLAERGHRKLLEDPDALRTITQQINKANSVKAKDPAANESQRKQSLERVSASFGLAPGEVDKAVRAWGEKAKDPYDLGIAALYEKNYQKASHDLAASLTRREENEAKAEQEVVDAAFFLGRSLYEEGKYRESVEAYRKAQKRRPVDPAILNNLALSLEETGDYAAAEPLYRSALAIDEKVLGQEHPDVAANLDNLANLLHAKGDYVGAEPLYRRALVIDEKALGPRHPSVATDLNNLAMLLKEKGVYAGAESLQRRALVIHEKALGPEHPDVAIDLNNLASLLEDKGDYVGAEPLYRRALAIKKKALGPGHTTVGTGLINLGGLLIKAKRDYAGAESLYRQALEIDEKALGPDHPSVAIDLISLAALLEAKGDNAGAEPLYRRALEIDEKALGPDHHRSKQPRDPAWSQGRLCGSRTAVPSRFGDRREGAGAGSPRRSDRSKQPSNAAESEGRLHISGASVPSRIGYRREGAWA